MANHKALRLWGSFAVAAAVCVAASPARGDDAFSLSSATNPPNNAWRSLVLADDAATLKPVKVTTSGNVANAQALVNGSGTATLTNIAGQSPPMIVLALMLIVSGLVGIAFAPSPEERDIERTERFRREPGVPEPARS